MQSNIVDKFRIELAMLVVFRPPYEAGRFSGSMYCKSFLRHCSRLVPKICIFESERAVSIGRTTAQTMVNTAGAKENKEMTLMLST